jgi:phenylalanyl-tRNA synthetase alpha chain
MDKIKDTVKKDFGVNETNKVTGHLHPITSFVRQAVSIFEELGFSFADGPELEQEFYNFDALNIPKDHPSRDMQDTFWIKTPDLKNAEPHNDKSERKVLRTQTSAVQVRYLEKNKENLPCAIIVPGKVYRNEATDATHEAQFYQLEALYVNKDVSLSNLKSTIEHFFKKLYGNDMEICFRPSFFPFVEPGVEVDMLFNGKWLEMGGAGMVHSNVLKSAGIDSNIWKGFAFGFGIDRLVMRQNNIPDVRMLFDGDLRFINQF